MKNKIIFVCLCLIPITSFGAPTNRVISNPAGPVLKVLLARRLSAVQISGFSSQLYLMPYLGGTPRNLAGEAKIELGKKDSVTINGVKVVPPALIVGRDSSSPLRFQSGVFPGALEIQRMGNELWVINLIPLEDYLPRTVAAEMQPSWELEALKAQAVAARSYALYMHQHPKAELYDLERDIHDQVYSGVADPPAKVVAAVQSTKGEVLSNGNRAIKAYYHSRCGGMTDSAENVWSEKTSRFKKSHSIVCPYCGSHPYYWKAVIALSDFLKGLALPIWNRAIAFVPVVRSGSGRIQSLTVIAGAQKETLTGNELRDRLGYGKIKSTLFNWKISGDHVEFNGVGSGHGVGMCQWGARELARQGRNYRQILTYFYPSVSIQKLSG